MRPVARAGRDVGKPSSAAVCENEQAETFGSVLLDEYDAEQWVKLETCRACPQYQAIRP